MQDSVVAVQKSPGKADFRFSADWGTDGQEASKPLVAKIKTFPGQDAQKQTDKLWRRPCFSETKMDADSTAQEAVVRITPRIAVRGMA